MSIFGARCAIFIVHEFYFRFVKFIVVMLTFAPSASPKDTLFCLKINGVNVSYVPNKTSNSHLDIFFSFTEAFKT